jgi:hypothetical protein
MAQIDTSIAMGFRPVQIESPMNQMAAMAQLEGMQQQRQQNALKMQEYQRGMQQRNALATIHADPKIKIGSEEYLSRVAQEVPDLYPDVAANALRQAELSEKIDERRFKNLDRRLGLFKSIVPNINSEHGVYQYVQAAYNDPDLKPILEKIQPLEDALESNVAAFYKDPNEWRMQASGVSAEKLAEIAREKSKPVVVAPGGTLVSPTGEALFTAPKEFSPSEMQKNYAAAKEDGFRGTFADFVDQSRESETEREWRRAKDAGTFNGTFVAWKREMAKANKIIVQAPTVSAGGKDLVATAILESRLDPGKVNSRNIGIIATTLEKDPGANLKELSIDAMSGAASSKALATQSAKILTAANEADSMIKIVRNTAAKVDKTQYPTINAIQNAVDKGTGGQEIVKLNTALNALVNSYARAINPTGVSTVSDKNHAREIINSNYATGQLDAILDVMQEEMRVAKASPGEASAQLKEQRNAPKAAPPAKAIEYLRANPSMRDAFDAKYGAGAADRALKGK